MTNPTTVAPEYRRFCRRAERVCELAEWERETGRRLPWSAWFVLAVEDRGGRVDLATGAVHLLPVEGGRP